MKKYIRPLFLVTFLTICIAGISQECVKTTDNENKVKISTRRTAMAPRLDAEIIYYRENFILTLVARFKEVKTIPAKDSIHFIFGDQSETTLTTAIESKGQADTISGGTNKIRLALREKYMADFKNKKLLKIRIDSEDFLITEDKTNQIITWLECIGSKRSENTSSDAMPKSDVTYGMRRFAMRKYPDNQQMQDYIYEEQLKAYEYMQTVGDAVCKKIAETKYPDDYSMQKYIYDEQASARRYMMSVSNTDKKAKAVDKYPNDFTMQKYIYDSK